MSRQIVFVVARNGTKHSCQVETDDEPEAKKPLNTLDANTQATVSLRFKITYMICKEGLALLSSLPECSSGHAHQP